MGIMNRCGPGRASLSIPPCLAATVNFAAKATPIYAGAFTSAGFGRIPDRYVNI
jgi:hypothetical protein